MRTLNANEVDAVSGGFVWFAIAAAALLTGCAGTTVEAEGCKTNADGSKTCAKVKVTR